VSEAPLTPDALVIEKFDVLSAVFACARAQRDALAVDDFAEFHRILEERDGLLAELQRLVDSTPELPSNVIAFPTEWTERARRDDALALDTVIRGIVDLDEHNETLLNHRLGDLTAEAPALRRGREALAAYRLPKPHRGYVDRAS